MQSPTLHLSLLSLSTPSLAQKRLYPLPYIHPTSTLTITANSSSLPIGLIEYLLVVQHKLPAVALLFPVQSLRTAIQHHMIPLVQSHIPPSEVGAEGMRAMGAMFAFIGVDHGVADGTEVVLGLSGDEVARLKLEGS